MKKTFAIGLVMTLGLAAQAAHASQYGCTVLLCLAGHWENISQCVPPVNQLFESLALGGEFPGCDMSDGNDASNNYTSMGTDPVEPCPADYPTQIEYLPTTINEGQTSIPAHRTCQAVQQSCVTVSYHGYNGSNAGQSQVTIPPGYTQQSTDAQGNQVYCGYNQTIVYQLRTDPNYINVYVNGSLYNTVWWKMP